MYGSYNSHASWAQSYNRQHKSSKEGKFDLLWYENVRINILLYG